MEELPKESQNMDAIYRAKRGDLEFLKEAPLDILLNARDSSDDTVLSIVVHDNRLDCCELICKRCPSLLYHQPRQGGNIPLHIAAYSGNLDILKLLISACDEADQGGDRAGKQRALTLRTTSFGYNAMHKAIYGHQPESIKLLLEADPNNELLRAGDRKNNTPLHLAAAAKSENEIARLLIKADPDYSYGANSDGKTPLLIAIDKADWHKDDREMLKLILELQPTQSMDSVNENGWTALHYSVAKKFVDTIGYIIQSCPESSKVPDKEGQNFFHHAVKLRNVKMVKHILGMKEITSTVLNSLDNLGRTPWDVAAVSQNESMIICLHEDPRVNKKLSVTKNLHWVVEKHNFVMMNMFMETNADFLMNFDLEIIQNAVDEEGDTILFKAAQENHLFLCKELYKRCPSLIYHQGKDGSTALHHAAWRGEPEMLKFLIGACTKSYNDEYADDNIESGGGTKIPQKMLLTMVDEQGDTALHRAVLNHKLEAVKLLVDADPYYQYGANTTGDTPIMISVREARSKENKFDSGKIRRLLFKMQQLSQTMAWRGKNGWTLLHQATFEGDLSLIEDIIKFCPNCLEIVDNEGKNFLHIAARWEKVQVVRQVLRAKDIPFNVLNDQDNDGNTPLHIAAITGNEPLTRCFLFDPRIIKTTVNKDGQHVLHEINFSYDKTKAGLGALVVTVDPSVVKDQRDFDLVVGALIATVSFTAGITVPGGYNSDRPNQGTAVFSKQGSFATFILSNTFALIFSLYAVFSHFCARRLHKGADIIYQLNVATLCTLAAIYCMMAAFIAGSFAVLANSNWHAIVVCFICFFFFVFACCPMWKIASQPKRAAPASQHKHSA